MSYINIEIPPPKKKATTRKKDTLFSHTEAKSRSKKTHRNEKHNCRKNGVGFNSPPSKWVNKNHASSRKADESMQPLPKEVEEMLAASCEKKKDAGLTVGQMEISIIFTPNFLCFWMGNIFFWMGKISEHLDFTFWNLCEFFSGKSWL